MIFPLSAISEANFDPTGKQVTFYPSSLMISHDVRPLIFYSETKLMHLITKLKAISPGPLLTISNNCSSSQQIFFNKLLATIHNTQKVMHRLLTLSSFSNLLECDSYLRRYYTYSTGLTSRMSCPRHYQSSLGDCKTWALRNCHGFSANERMFLRGHSRSKRSSFLCHAGFFGLFRKIYESLGHSCTPNHVTNLKNTLRRVSGSLGLSQSMMHVLNGKIVYILKTTDSLTTKLNRLSQDLKVIDNTFTTWQNQLNKLVTDNACHESILFEFLSKHSVSINRAFASMLRLTEMQDVLHQFSTLSTKTLFGFPHLPPFLHPQITSRLEMDSSMLYTSKALAEGFPLLINPMIDIEHIGSQIEASVLLTLPEIPTLDSLCTIEYLTPVKFNSSGQCYSGPVTRLNLVLISCPHSKQIISSEALNKCYQDASAFVCPLNLLTFATNISWLGFPFNPHSKFTFPRNHVAAADCSNLHPFIHLGGRSFLASTTTVLPLSSGPITTTPLAVYNIPCNASFSTMVTGIGQCSDTLTVSVPLTTASSLQYISWQAALSNDSQPFWAHPSFDIPPPTVLNHTVLAALDSTMKTLDGQLTTNIAATNDEIDAISTETAMGPTDYVAGVALALSLLSCIGLTIFLSYYRHHGEPVARRSTTNQCVHCNRLASRGEAPGPHPPPEGNSN